MSDSSDNQDRMHYQFALWCTCCGHVAHSKQHAKKHFRQCPKPHSIVCGCCGQDYPWQDAVTHLNNTAALSRPQLLQVAPTPLQPRYNVSCSTGLPQPPRTRSPLRPPRSQRSASASIASTASVFPSSSVSATTAPSTSTLLSFDTDFDVLQYIETSDLSLFASVDDSSTLDDVLDVIQDMTSPQSSSVQILDTVQPLSVDVTSSATPVQPIQYSPISPAVSVSTIAPSDSASVTPTMPAANVINYATLVPAMAAQLLWLGAVIRETRPAARTAADAAGRRLLSAGRHWLTPDIINPSAMPLPDLLNILTPVWERIYDHTQQ